MTVDMPAEVYQYQFARKGFRMFGSIFIGFAIASYMLYGSGMPFDFVCTFAFIFGFLAYGAGSNYLQAKILLDIAPRIPNEV